jgi:putative acetyltransferase
MSFIIRPVEPQDNPALADLIVSTLQEHGCVGEGYACNDPEVQYLYDFYQQHRAQYWVLWEPEKQRIVGGGGYSQLTGTSASDRICELQKLYFKPSARGQGWGSKLLLMVIEAARKDDYQEMYLETVPMMQPAIHLYEKLGFQHLATHRGNTGHHERCQVRMSLDLH